MDTHRGLPLLLVVLLPLGTFAVGAEAAPGEPPGHSVAVAPSAAVFTSSASTKFSDTANTPAGFVLAPNDLFGSAVANVGDLDGNGADDYAVGAEGTEETPGMGNTDARAGAVYVFLMNLDGTVGSTVRIASDSPIGVAPAALTADITEDEDFGDAVVGAGDLNGDTVPDILVGASADRNASDVPVGAVYVLYMNNDGTVGSFAKISGEPITGTDSPNFGNSLTVLGDLDGAGGSAVTVAVGAPGDGGFADGFNQGSVHVLFLNGNGTVASSQEISDFATNTAAPAGFALDPGDFFGTGVAAVGDLDGNGVSELAVGAAFANTAAAGCMANCDRGAVFLFFMNANGTASSFLKHDDSTAGLLLDSADDFGRSVAAVGDRDADGVPDLGVGAPNDDDGGQDRGAVYLLYLNANGTVKGVQKISDTEGDFDGVLDNGDQFGYSLAALGDRDGDGVSDLGVGAIGDDDGGASQGALWKLFFDDPACPPNLVISDFQTAPDAQEFVDLSNISPTKTVDFATVNCVLGGFRSASYLALTPAGILAPGSTLRLGASASTPDVPFPDGSLFDAYAALALLNRTDLPNGTSIPAVQPDLVTSLVYLTGGQVYGFSHPTPEGVAAYCANYAGRLHPFGISQCAPSRASAGGGPVALTLDEMLEQALAERDGTDQSAALPLRFALGAAYPNPVARAATLTVEVPEAATVRLVVFDVLGRAVVVLMDEAVEAGRHPVALDAVSLPAGSYIARLTADTFEATQRFTVVR